MKIGAGKHRGRGLNAPSGKGTRPPLARLRRSLCDMLGPRIPGARVLDLYAGTGSLSLEALSRGAARAVMVERDPEAVRALEENVERLGVASQVAVMAVDVRVALPDLAASGVCFDIVFCDPPFADRDETDVKIACSLLDDGGALLWRTRNSASAPSELAGAILTRVRRYGASRVSIYRKGDGK